MLNKIILQGRLTAEPDLRQTTSGVFVCSFTVAVDRDFKDKNGEKQTDFVYVVAWRNTAEFVSKWFHKGSLILVDGSLQSRKYEDKNGQKRTTFDVVANTVYFGGEKRDNVSQFPQEKSVDVEPDLDSVDVEPDLDSDDLPF